MKEFPHLHPVTTQPVKPLLNVSVGDGKYTVAQFTNGALHALRYGEPWRDCCGDKLIYALAAEVEALRKQIEDLQQGAHRG